MGRRITRSLHRMNTTSCASVERGEPGRRLLAEMGLKVTELEAALPGAEVVVLAVPDLIIREVAQDVVPPMDLGASMLFLDPGAVAAERVLRCAVVNCYVTHPTRPPLYSLIEEPEAGERSDFWGGGLLGRPSCSP